jgi:hypothetical protein
MKKTLIPGLAVLLSACAVVPGDRDTDRPLLDPTLLEMTTRLPGDYTTVLTRSQRLDGDHPLLMNIEPQPGSSPEQLDFLMTQLDGQRSARLFLLSIRAGDDRQRPEGFFAPLDSAGQARRQCAMEFNLRQDGFSASTDPDTCRFGEGAQMTGLLKEIAFDGHQLVIGDRLVNLSTGEPLADDQIHAFSRVRAFSGWAGRREGDGWHRSTPFELHSGDDQIELIDAAGMSLGMSLNLHLHDPGQDQDTILRLTVSDSESGEIIAQGWADPDAESLGIALPAVQIGLQRID